jgi:hypothetical protein
MYTLIRSMPVRRFLLEQAPTLTAAFTVAEVFYKFHSFALECLAFLVTWGVLDASVQAVRSRLLASKT